MRILSTTPAEASLGTIRSSMKKWMMLSVPVKVARLLLSMKLNCCTPST